MPRTQTLLAVLLSACASGQSLPPVEGERFPEPEPAEDWEDWGEGRADTPPGRGGTVDVIGTRLTGSEIEAALSGQTLRGCYPNGERFVERLASDGRFYEVDQAETYAGRWSVESDTLCFDYEAGPNAEAPATCFPVSREAGELYFYAADLSGIVAATVCPRNQG